MTVTQIKPVTTFEELPINQIVQHPKEIRHDVGTPAEMEEMAASIREAGIIEPLIVAAPFGPNRGRRTSWRYVLIAGQRRLIGAVDAHLATVPCIIRHDLDTPAKQLLVMHIENDHRKGLRVTEQADGYQALLELDYTPAVIAKKLGRTKSFVEGRLSLAGLPQRARDGVDHAQITIADALELASFTNSTTVAMLSEFVGTRDWSWRLNEAKGDRDRAQAAKDNPPEPEPAAPPSGGCGDSTTVAKPAPKNNRAPDVAPEVIPEGRAARAALLRTLDTAARVRHEYLAAVITTGYTNTALAIARGRVLQAARDAFNADIVDRVLPHHERAIRVMTLPQAVIALDVLSGLIRDADLARSASAWRQTHTQGWRQHLTGVLGYTWSAAELELLGKDT